MYCNTKGDKMAYRCFFCNKEIDPKYIKKKVQCPYCGSRIIYKERDTPLTLKAI